jgi:hypothetical protein
MAPVTVKAGEVEKLVGWAVEITAGPGSAVCGTIHDVERWRSPPARVVGGSAPPVA